MKLKVLLVLSFLYIFSLPITSSAKVSCESVFSKPASLDHFITSQTYFGLTRAGGYSPHVIAKSDGRIVVTPALRQVLNEKSSKKIEAFVTIINSEAGLRNSLRYYDLELKP